MKVLYGVQGIGNGYIVCVCIMVEVMVKCDDIDVDFVFLGWEFDGYFDMECFGNYCIFNGFIFVIVKGKVSQWQILKQVKLFMLFCDINQFDVLGYDVLFNDFEFIIVWVVRWWGLILIFVSYQVVFVYDVLWEGESLSDCLIMCVFVLIDIQLGVYWYYFD